MRFNCVIFYFALGNAATYTDYWGAMCSKLVTTNLAISNQCAPEDKVCLCGNRDWQRSVLTCIVHAADAASIDDEEGIIESWSALQRVCKATAGAPDLPPAQYAMRELLYDLPGRNFASANTSGEPGAFFVSEEQLITNNIIEAGRALHKEAELADLYGQMMLLSVAGVLVIVAFVNFARWVAPGMLQSVCNTGIMRAIRRHIIIPAVRTSQKNPKNKYGIYFVIPSRLTTIFLSSYVALNAILLGVNHPVEPSPFMYPIRKVALYAGVGRRAVFLALYNIVLVWLFAGRNNLLISLTGVSYETFNTWHRWLAVLTVVEIVVHAGLHTQWMRTFNAMGKYWSFPYLQWGFVSLLLMGFMLIQASKTVRRLNYDLFVVIHIALGAIVLAASWKHIAHHGLGRQQLIACVSIWAFDRAARAVRIMRSGLGSAEVTVHDDDAVVELSVEWSGVWQPRGGDYVYIHFLRGWNWWQSHPFTVLEPASEDNCGKLQLMIKARSGITRSLLRKRGEKIPVLLDGPYGHRINTRAFGEILYVAGGIGITAVYSRLVDALRSSSPDQLHTIHWYISTKDPVETWLASAVEEFRHDDRVQINVHITGSSDSDSGSGNDEKSLFSDAGDADKKGLCICYGRVPVKNIVAEMITDSRSSILVFVCGPGLLNDEVRDAVVTNIVLTTNYVQFDEEFYSM